jgi:hypothetical protein
MKNEKMIGYKLINSECPGWMFLGTDLNEVGNAIVSELQNNEGLSVEECAKLTIEAFEITQEEIDKMPEFQGW